MYWNYLARLYKKQTIAHAITCQLHSFQFVFFFHGWYRSSASANDVFLGTLRSILVSQLSAMNCVGDGKLELLSRRAAETLLGLKQAASWRARFSGTSISRLESNSWVEHFEGGHTLFGLLAVPFKSEIHGVTIENNNLFCYLLVVYYIVIPEVIEDILKFSYLLNQLLDLFIFLFCNELSFTKHGWQHICGDHFRVPSEYATQPSTNKVIDTSINKEKTINEYNS